MRLLFWGMCFAVFVFLKYQGFFISGWLLIFDSLLDVSVDVDFFLFSFLLFVFVVTVSVIETLSALKSLEGLQMGRA